MAATVQGKINAGVNLTTTFGGGTAGSAKETNNLGGNGIDIAPGLAAGQQLTEVWSQTYTNVSASFEIDLTALPGVGGRSVNFTTPGVRLVMVVNSDLVAGHDFTVGPGVSNGFAALWPGTGAYWIAYGGLPTASSLTGQPVGNTIIQTVTKPVALVVDAAHKTVKIDPGANTISSLTLLFAG